jgi:hypothetical protein
MNDEKELLLQAEYDSLSETTELTNLLAFSLLDWGVYRAQEERACQANPNQAPVENAGF